MKYFISLVLSFFLYTSTGLLAQEKHFVFIQNENKQPFYVSMNGRNYSSTASGYVIIPKLSEGDYSINIGFAGNETPEQSFRFSVGKKDVGFSLKKMDSKGWSLFNLQSYAVIQGAPVSDQSAQNIKKQNVEPEIVFAPKKPEPAKADQPVAQDGKPKTSKESSAITRENSADKEAAAKTEISTPINTSGEPNKEIKKEAITEVTKVEPKKPEPVVEDKMTATVEQKGKEKLAAENTKPVKQERGAVTRPNNSNIEKLGEVKSSEGVLLTYVDSQYKRPDTIQVIIPATKMVSAEVPVTASAKEVVNDTNGQKTEKADTRFLPIEVTPLKGELPKENVTNGEITGSIAGNSNCQEKATDDDYTRVRRKMARENTDEDMIAEAKKYYRNKCFTMAQIKSLSTLFLSDEGRYRFFDASYPYVFDPEKYSELETEFIDPNYADRFRSLIKK